MYIIFDTETTGLPRDYNAPVTDLDNWPRCIQIAWQLHDEMGNLLEQEDYLVKPDGFDIPYDSEKIHGISTLLANEKGVEMSFVLERFNEALKKTKFVVGQNVGFDIKIMGAEFYRAKVDTLLATMPVLDTCTETTASLVKIPGGRGGRYKLPTLTELHQYLFGIPFSEAHNATADVEATTRCFLELIRKEVFTEHELQQSAGHLKLFKEQNPKPFELIGLKHINLKKESAAIRKKLEEAGIIESDEVRKISKETQQAFETATFAHLHNHTQFSVLQSTIDIGAMIQKTAKGEMSAIAMTDHGNMMGAFKFVSAVLDHNKNVKKKNEAAIERGEKPTEKEIKPIVGCEFFVCENHKDKSRKDNGYQIVLLAKNKKG